VVALGPRLSIGITIEVTPFIDILLARLLLFLLEEFLFNAYHSLRREPTSHGFRVIFLTLAR
jgi:biopolymer transport protein ExbD